MDRFDSRTDGHTIHVTLQGKGGVGKSLVAAILTQYFMSRSCAVRCIDTDPLNRTLSQYTDLDVDDLDLLRDGVIDQRGFDQLIETVLTNDASFVVDSGASTFIPLWNYFLENNVLSLLHDAGRQVCIHTVVTGGQALEDTLKGFGEVAETSRERNIVVWLNEYFGRIEADGKTFPEMAVYRANEAKVLGSVGIPRRNRDTFGRDIEEMVVGKLTFDAAVESPGSTIMTKQRLRVVQRDLFEQLDVLGLVRPLHAGA